MSENTRQKREYTEHEKGAALAVVDFYGDNVRKAASVLEIPYTTLIEWVKGRHVGEKAQGIRTDKKIDLALRMDGILEKLAHGLEDEEKIAKAKLNEVSTAFGTIYDKRQLSRGEPTNISQNIEPAKKREAVKDFLKETGILQSEAVH